MQFLSPVLPCLFLALLTGCGPVAPEEAVVDSKPMAVAQAWVTLLPQQAMVAAVAGDRFAVEVMVRPGQGPESYSPSALQMARLAKADVYFGIGMPFERRILTKIEQSMDQVQFVQTGEWLEPAEHGHVHHAGCVHGEQDPHLWMDPLWMRSFVEQVRAVLTERSPEDAELFAANAQALSQSLEQLDLEITARLAPYAGRAFYINHPSLGHFAERYGLVQRSIEHAGSTPSARQIASLIDAAQGDAVAAVFSQPEFSRTSAEVLARALEVEVLTIDVMASDYLANMRRITEQLVRSFQP